MRKWNDILHIILTKMLKHVKLNIPHLNEIACNVSSRNVQSPGEMGQREALVHGTNVGYSIARIHHHPCQKAWVSHTDKYWTNVRNKRCTDRNKIFANSKLRNNVMHKVNTVHGITHLEHKVLAQPGWRCKHLQTGMSQTWPKGQGDKQRQIKPWYIYSF